MGQVMRGNRLKYTLFIGLPRQGWYGLGIALILSILLHGLSLFSLVRVQSVGTEGLVARKTGHVKTKVRITERKKTPQPRDEEKNKKILETPLAETAAPKIASRLGAQDHLTQKEMRQKESLNHPRSVEVGIDGEPRKVKREDKQVKSGKKAGELVNRDLQARKKRAKSLVDPSGIVALSRPGENKPRNIYESLMPRSQEMAGQVKVGYREYLGEEAEIGDRIDFNTSNFRYLSYFSRIREAFELVWTYPSEAVGRGLQGEVKLEFTILNNGNVSRIKVLSSSGHKILDDAVIEAINLASPFPPLPTGFRKDRLTIVGTYRYVLTNYAGAM